MFSLLLACVERAPSPPAKSAPEDAPPADTRSTETADTALPSPTTTDSTAPQPPTGDTAVVEIVCDDGLMCTTESLDPLGRCIETPLYDCGWPAAAPSGAVPLGGGDLELQDNQSGVTWDAANRRLWVVRNTGPSAVFRLLEDGAGDFVVETDAYGARAQWDDIGDIESLTLIDPVTAPNEVALLDEEREHLVLYDLSTLGVATALRDWDLSEHLPEDDRAGAEAVTFVPDIALAEWGFVDDAGLARVSALGMGGLFFVGHQNGGQVYVFDLSALDDTVTYVATFDTERTETSGLEFDASTGRLYLWHGASFNDLEIARLSSTDLGGPHRKLDTEYSFDQPGVGNLEGVAIFGAEDCAGGLRSLLLVQDDGGAQSIQRYPDWPIGCP